MTARISGHRTDTQGPSSAVSVRMNFVETLAMRKCVTAAEKPHCNSDLKSHSKNLPSAGGRRAGVVSGEELGYAHCCNPFLCTLMSIVGAC